MEREYPGDVPLEETEREKQTPFTMLENDLGPILTTHVVQWMQKFREEEYKTRGETPFQEVGGFLSVFDDSKLFNKYVERLQNYLSTTKEEVLEGIAKLRRGEDFDVAKIRFFNRAYRKASKGDFTILHNYVMQDLRSRLEYFVNMDRYATEELGGSLSSFLATDYEEKELLDRFFMSFFNIVNDLPTDKEEKPLPGNGIVLSPELKALLANLGDASKTPNSIIRRSAFEGLPPELKNRFLESLRMIERLCYSYILILDYEQAKERNS